MENETKIAFITGASSGFGLHTTIALAKEGFQVIASMRNAKKRHRLEEEAHKDGVFHQIEVAELDITDFLAVDRVIKNVLARYGKIDILINNAGYAQGGFAEETEIDDWKQQFETNVFGTIAVTKAVLPSMREKGKGLIINISSISGHFGFPGLGPYAASKFALEGFSESLRLEMLPFGVKVVLIEPSSYRTDIWSKGIDLIKNDSDSPYADFKGKMLQKVERISETAGDPDEVVAAILKAVKTPSPKLRYPVGRGTKTMVRVKNLIPWNWLEKIVKKQLEK